MVIKMGKYPYSFSEAVIYSSVLLITLWWIPVLGPIIIGYITGRKSGGPLKGLFAMAVPIFLYLMLLQAIQAGLINIPQNVNSYIHGTILTATAALPFANYFENTINMATNVGMHIENYLYYAPPSFFIMLSFAFIGGAVSRQIILEKGIYPERKEKVKEEPKEKEEIVSRKAPVPYNPYPEYAQQPNPQMYGLQNQPSPYIQPYNAYPSPQMQQGYYEQHAQMQVPQGYYMQPQYKEDAMGGYQRDEPISIHPSKPKRGRTKRKKIKEFRDEENSKFVVHPMDTKKEIAIKKKRINNEHSIAFL